MKDNSNNNNAIIARLAALFSGIPGDKHLICDLETKQLINLTAQGFKIDEHAIKDFSVLAYDNE